MDKRITYSQNFLINKALVSELIEKSSITDKDIVYEVGAGEGIITNELLKKAEKVIAFELDVTLFDKLSKKFQNEKSLELEFGNFLDFDLPNLPYKVFSNIPFNITSEVIKKLTQSENSPNEAYLVLQEEAAEKFMGKPYVYKNSLMAILLKPWFDFEIIYKFKSSDFYPQPNVKIILLRITRKTNSVIDPKNRKVYEDFITHIFNAAKPLILKNLIPSKLDFEEWINIFNDFLSRSDRSVQDLIRGSYAKMLKQQEKLEKIHRTRVDKEWRKFRA